MQVTVGGRKTNYLEAGAGRPLILIHAFPLSAEMWRPQLGQVPHGWRLIAPDVRGLGDNPAGETAPTMDDLAADVGGLMDALGIEQAVIGGLSMGGYITLALFKSDSRRFTAMILADTKAAADTEEGRQGRRAMSELVRSRGVGAVADQMLPKLLGETTRCDRPDVVARAREMIEANTVAGVDGAIHAMLERADSTSGLAAIDCPALILVGEEDQVTPPADAAVLHRGIAGSRLVTIPGAGHLSSLEAPELFTPALSAFLQTI